MRYVGYIFAVVIAMSFYSSDQEVDDYNYVSDQEASGMFSLYYRDDSIKLLCKDVEVNRGMYSLCEDKNPKYDFFIIRDKDRGEWFNKLFRVYDYFPPVNSKDTKTKYFEFEKRNARFIKEDFVAYGQEAGLTLKHHESCKGLVNYKVANNKNEITNDDTKIHQNYDWDEIVSGRFEFCFSNGKRKKSHKYSINRYMILDQNLTKSRVKYSLDIKILGTIKEWHPNFKKKSKVEYQESYLVSKSFKSKVKEVSKSKRTATVTQWHESGKIAASGELLNGLESGTWMFYNSKGLLVEKIEYVFGERSGSYYEYYPDNNKVRVKGKYLNGNKVGEWISYDREGKKTTFAP